MSKKGKPAKSLNDLWNEVREGGITPEEVDEVVRKIKECTPGQDENLHLLLCILGKAQAVQHRKLVEKFLYYPTASEISAMALTVLCGYWCYAEDYLDILKAFIRGVDWDKGGDAGLTAISLAGVILMVAPEMELLQLLLNIFEGKKTSELIEESLHREAAYESLCRAMGREWNEILAQKEEDMSVIKQAHQTLEQLKQQHPQKEKGS